MLDGLLRCDEVHYSLDRQIFVLGNMDVFDVVVVQVGLLAAEDIFEKVDGDIVCRKISNQCVGSVYLP